MAATYSETGLEQKQPGYTAASSSAPAWSHCKVLCLWNPFYQPSNGNFWTLLGKIPLAKYYCFEIEENSQKSKQKLKAPAEKTPLVSPQSLTSQHLTFLFLKPTSVMVLGPFKPTSSNSTTDLDFTTWLHFSKHRARVLWEGFTSASIHFQVLQPWTAENPNKSGWLRNSARPPTRPGPPATDEFCELSNRAGPICLPAGSELHGPCPCHILSCARDRRHGSVISGKIMKLYEHPTKQKPDMVHPERWRDAHKYYAQLGIQL